MVSTSILPSAVNKMARRACLTAAAWLLLATAASAQTAPATTAPAPAAKPAVAPANAQVKPLWVSLSPAQKVALEPLAAEWDRLEAPRKQKWLEIAGRFGSMKPDEQARVHDKMREWVKMTPDERRLVRENYTKAKKLDVTQKSAQWEKYQQLPEEQKQKLAAEAVKSKKQLTNLPPPAQANAKTVAPIKKTPLAALPPCPAGSARQPAAPGVAANTACVASAPAITAGVANQPVTSAIPPAATSSIPAANALTAPANGK